MSTELEKGATDPQDSKPDPKEKKHDAFEKTTLVTAIVGVIILCVYTRLTAYQASIAKDTEERQLRAYLLVNIGKTRKSGNAVSADLLIQQVGATPAYDLWLAAAIKIAGSDKDLDKNIWAISTAQSAKWHNLFGAETKKTTVTASFPPEDISRMKPRGQKFYLFGAVCHITTFYGDDGFPGRHQYPFCFSFAPGEDGIPCEQSPFKQPMCPNHDHKAAQ
jgi:hypothetical protein